MKLSQRLQNLFDEKGPEISISEILETNQDKLYGFLLVIFSLPVALPLTPPGISIPFAVAVGFIAFQIFLKKAKPSLPARLTEAKIDVVKNQKFANLMLRFIRFMERFIRPRQAWVYKTVLSPKITAIIVFLSALMMALPFPVTNTPPGFAITLIGLGMMEEDGLFGLAGVLAFVLSFVLLAVLGFLVYTLGWEAVNYFDQIIKS